LFNFADAQMDIKDSWFSFINDGTVTKDAIRPEILRSWQRCRNLIEPFAEGKSYLSQDELMLRKSRNLEMIKIAWPIMKELGTVVDKSMVLLSDAEGFLLEVVGNNELLPVGICCQESVIGSCTNGRIEDLQVAAQLLQGKKIHPELRTIILPGTQQIYLEALRRGYIEIFIEAGAVVSTPTCGPCLGGHMGILARGEKALATTNRNFVGRMGHPESEVYLASPAVAAASAIKGRIAAPWEA
jgi:homoaconitase/3-isopropylmalate dehydratase large subunit